MTSSDGGPPQSEGGFDVPPSVPRLLLLPVLVIVYGLLMGAFRVSDSWVEALVAGVPYLVGGAVFFGYRWRRRRRPVLRIDALGVKNQEGQRIHTWLHTGQVWVGPTPGRWIPAPLRFPTIVAWTHAGIEFGRRARHGPTAALNHPVATGLTVDQLAEVVRRFTDASVLTGADIELAELPRRLLGPPDRSP